MSLPSAYPILPFSGERDQRLLLAETLRNLRRQAKLTGVGLAKKIGASQSKISKIENAQVIPSSEDVADICEAVQASPEIRDQLVELATRLHTEMTPWQSMLRRGLARKQNMAGQLGYESKRIAEFQQSVVPGLLQTAEYARRVLTISERMANLSVAADIPEAVAARVARQSILFDTSKEFHFILTEAALRAPLGDQDLTRDQLDRLLSLSSLQNLRLGIIPLSRPVVAIPFNNFAIYDDRLVVIETYTSELVLSDAPDLAIYRSALAQFETMADYGRDAAALISHVLSSAAH